VTAAIRSTTGAANARIMGAGGYRPARVVTNAEIIERIDSSDEWIRERSGITQRHFAAEDETVVDMAAAAAGKAVANSGIDPQRIGAVIVATVTHLDQTPSAASDLAYRLGAVNAAAFDISAACAGFCHGLALANDMVRGGSAEHVVVVGVEKLSDILDLEDRSTAFIFGDGAGAVVVGPSDIPGIGPVQWGSDGSRLGAINTNANLRDLRNVHDLDENAVWPTLRMEGQAVFRWAVQQMSPVAQQALDAAGITAAELDVFIPHQANVRIIDAMAKALALPDTVAIARDIVTTGNTSAASIPLAMARMLEEGEARSGQTALLIGFGAGLAHAAQVVTLP
jgi:3-oxoacyl-[acyl-carrier-protein] synthase-3